MGDRAVADYREPFHMRPSNVSLLGLPIFTRLNSECSGFSSRLRSSGITTDGTTNAAEGFLMTQPVPMSFTSSGAGYCQPDHLGPRRPRFLEAHGQNAELSNVGDLALKSLQP